MESARWLVVSSMVVTIASGSLVPGRIASAAAGAAGWDPPPCGSAAAPPGGTAWYRLDPVLDRAGTLAGRRLAVGVAGGLTRSLDLAPESFASGPAGGLVLTGEDDGTVSRLRFLDPARGCAVAIGTEPAVIRSAIVAPGGAGLFEHRVDRSTRADLGVWRRPVAGGPAGRVLEGLAPDPALGPTFVTELVVADDGALVVSSCAPGGCRVRVLDPATGAVSAVAGVGPALGVTRGSLVARAACTGDPCPLVAIDLASGARRIVVPEAFRAALAGGRVVVETAGGYVTWVEVATGRHGGLLAGGQPLGSSSMASAGAEAPPGSVALAPGGVPGGRSVTVTAVDPSAASSRLPEVSR